MEEPMAVKVDIYPHNLEMTDRINDYVVKKMSKLDRFLTDVVEKRVDLNEEKSARNPNDRQVAQITLRGNGYILRTEERSDDILAAVDMAAEKMERKIERLKGKRMRGRAEGAAASIAEQTAPVPAEPELEFEEEELVPVIARRKTFVLTPMNELEAMEQMRQLGHEDFFVFYNADTSKINVLYARRDGTYGLIDPTVG
jgi:putative sigma-54 modulation protein